MLRCFVIVIAFFFASPAAAKTLALIIGNDAYEDVRPLERAGADAQGYASFFQARGVEVHLHRDLNGRAMRRAVAGFLDKVAPGDNVIFIYAGHGWSDGTENFLAPTDIPRRGSEALIRAESFPLQNGVNGIVDQ